jgi:ABC-type ATPase with predicted acetyltransferase domain
MKQKIHFELTSKASDSFRCVKAVNSVDLDIEKKLSHVVDLDIDMPDDWNIGLIVGASGSGKSTLASHLYGSDCFETVLDLSLPVIEQFPKDMSYDACVSNLLGVGLSSVPCWVRPAVTLSNGQRFRAEIALQIARKKDFIVIDEWTSVVDRTVAKCMSACIEKYARRENKKIVLCSCHYDVEEWLQPNWVIDCNMNLFTRRLLQQRTEKLEFEIREVDKSTWQMFSKYHYLSDKTPGGIVFYFGLFHNDIQIGFQCFANYTPHGDKTKKMILHSNRTVIHPDYVGLGLGMKLIDETSRIMHEREYRIMGKFSSISVFKSMQKNILWVLRSEGIFTPKSGGNMVRKSGFRQKQKWWSFEYVASKT